MLHYIWTSGVSFKYLSRKEENHTLDLEQLLLPDVLSQIYGVERMENNLAVLL